MRIFLRVLLVLVVLIGVAGIYMVNGLGWIPKLPIGAVELSRIDDGTYTGVFKGGRWTQTVEVTVQAHRITGIKIIKGTLVRMEDMETQIINQVISEQTPQVDAKTGASVSTKALLKAVENALAGAVR